LLIVLLIPIESYTKEQVVISGNSISASGSCKDAMFQKLGEYHRKLALFTLFLIGYQSVFVCPQSIEIQHHSEFNSRLCKSKILLEIKASLHQQRGNCDTETSLA
jgi:hypothetical protein